MAEEVKFTKEELNNIGNFQGKYAQVRNDFGDMSLSRINLNNQLNALNNLESTSTLYSCAIVFPFNNIISLGFIPP